MALLFAAWWLLVLVTGARLEGRTAVVVLAVAITVLGVGECLYDAVQGPLVAGLAPDGSVGRYLAVSSFGWQVGFVVRRRSAACSWRRLRSRSPGPARRSASPGRSARWGWSRRSPRRPA